MYFFFFFSLCIMYTRFLEKDFTKSTFKILASIAIRKRQNILRVRILLRADRIYIFYYLKTERSISPTSVMSTGVQPSKRCKSRLYTYETQAIWCAFCSSTWTISDEWIHELQPTPPLPDTRWTLYIHLHFAKIASNSKSLWRQTHFAVIAIRCLSEYNKTSLTFL